MFIASFKQVSGNTTKFKADKNGELSFIGNVAAGSYKTSIINASVFRSGGYKENTLYLCDNTVRTLEDGTKFDNVNIIAEVSAMDLIKSKNDLGPAHRIVTAPVVETEEEEEEIAQPASKARTRATAK